MRQDKVKYYKLKLYRHINTYGNSFLSFYVKTKNREFTYCDDVI